MKKLLILLAAGIFLQACKKDTKDPDPTPVVPNEKGSATITINNTIDNAPLQLGTMFKNINGDSIKVNKYMYYISNVVLTKSDGAKFVEPASYHLINQADNATWSFNLTNIPAGNYKSVSFLIGVDSLSNVSGAQEGDLAPSKGMFWTWTTGYIMLKLEGYSPQSGAAGGGITYHVGGFKGVNNTLRTVNINFTGDLVVSKSGNPKLKIKSELNQLFKNPVDIQVSSLYYVMSMGADAVKLADNYKDMFTFESITP